MAEVYDYSMAVGNFQSQQVPKITSLSHLGCLPSLKRDYYSDMDIIGDNWIQPLMEASFDRETRSLET